MRGLPFWSSVAILIVTLVGVVIEPEMVVLLRNASYDALQRFHPRKTSVPGVRIIDIDEKSLQLHGQWPWPRTILATLVDRLHDAGVAVIAFDMVFAETDRTSPRSVGRQWPGNEELSRLLDRLPDHDAIFADALVRAPVVTGITSTDGLPSSAAPAVKAKFIIANNPAGDLLPMTGNMVANLAEFEKAAAGNGAFNFTSDYDGVVRHVPLLLRFHETLYPSLAAEALRVYQHAENIVVKYAPAVRRPEDPVAVKEIQVGSFPIATDPQGRMWLHFAKFSQQRYIPAWKILAGEVAADELADAIVLIGTSAKGLLDLRFSPQGEMIPGVEVHAQALEQMLEGTWLVRPEFEKAAIVFFMVTMWLAFLFLIPRIRLWVAVLFGVAATGLPVIVADFAFTTERLFFDPIFPALALAAVFLACLVSRHFLAEREKRWIREAFSRYVSPNLARHLIANPDQLKLGGETRECSFVLTDMEGFTALMERSQPADLVAILNSYLDGMVQVAFRHNGTLDRFVGDAVAVMFSAPVHQADHAQRALACALEMDDFARKFAAAKKAAGINFGRTRIGVNTGEVLVGNLGGRHMLDYRALGDPINTASRLEGVNKYLGTNICVSSTTVAKCPDFFGRSVGVLMVSGKEEPIAAFEPIQRQERNAAAMRDYNAAYALMSDRHPDALAAFEALCREYPGDPLAAFHLQRLRGGEVGNTIVLQGK